MSKINIKEIQDKIWGKCLRIENGIVIIDVTLEFGPRIIKYSLVDGKNVFCEDKKKWIAFKTPKFDKLKKDEKWVFYGGHRLWLGPQKDPNTYYPDNSPVNYTIDCNKVIFFQEREEWTGIRKEIKIELNEENSKVIVTHRIFNEGAWDIECYPWAITAMTGGGECIIPQSKEDTGELENRIIKLWKYSKINDPRLVLGDKYIRVKQVMRYREDLKIGTNNSEGWAAYLIDNNIFVKYFSGKCANNSTNFEVYVNGGYLEIESFSELSKIKHENYAEHKEVWKLYAHKNKSKISEKGIDLIVEKYIGLTP